GAALEPRIESTVASGLAYDTRHLLWQEPIDRSVWGLLPEFRDVNLRNLFSHRGLYFEQANPPKADGPPIRAGHHHAAPGRLAQSERVAQIIENLVRKAGSTPQPFSVHMDSVAVGDQLDFATITPNRGVFGNPFTLQNLLFPLGMKYVPNLVPPFP